jgi:HD-like signal output (HDOD) protein
MQCSSCKRLFITPKDFIRHARQPQLASTGELYLNCSCGFPLVLEPDTFGWYKPELFMSAEAACYFEQIKLSCNIPRLNIVAIQLKQALANEKVSSTEVARIAKSDAFIAAEILKQANAARNESASEVTTIEQAISLLGREKLALLCVAASFAELEIGSQVFSLNSYYYDSILNGLIADELARRFGLREHASRAHACAAYCNIGKVLAASTHGEALDKVQSLIAEKANGLDWRQAEIQQGEMDHTYLGEIAAVFWGLDAQIINVARYHHTTPDEGYLIDLPSTHLAVFANQLSHIVSSRPHMLNKPIIMNASRIFELSPAELHELCRSIQGLGTLAKSRAEAM